MATRIKWHGDEILDSLESATLEALWMVGQQTITEATQSGEVPVETGTLRRSATVTVGALPDPDEVHAGAEAGREMKNRYNIFDGRRRHFGSMAGAGRDRASVFVSWNTPYAAWLHETFGWTPRLDPRGHPKWIERALPKAWRRFGAFLRRAKRKYEVS